MSDETEGQVAGGERPLFMAVPLYTRADKEIYAYFEDPTYREDINDLTGSAVIVVMPKEITQRAGSVFYERAHRRFRVRKLDLPCLCLEDEHDGLAGLRLPREVDQLRDLFKLLSDLADDADASTTAKSIAHAIQEQLSVRVISLVAKGSAAASLFDHVSYPDSPRGRALQAIVESAYRDEPEQLRHISKTAGIDVSTINFAVAPNTLPRTVLERAAKQKKLPTFFAEIVLEKSVVAIHDRLWEALGNDAAAVHTMAAEIARSLEQFAVIPLATDYEGDLERIVKANEKFNDPAIFRHELVQREIRVARINFDGKGKGTGWLVASDILITAYHVVAPWIDQIEKVSALFDYKKIPNLGELILGPGRTVKLAAKPLLAFSEDDSKANELSADGAGAGFLDFAILRLAEPVGKQGLGPTGRGKEKRGHFQLPIDIHAFDKSDALFILGHPMLQGDSEAGPLKLTLGFPSQAAATASNRRVRYVVNTEVGNSGSPVLDQDFRPLVLHNGGTAVQPAWAAADEWKSGFNQGIPLAAIVAELRAQVADKKIEAALLKELGL